MKKIRIPPLAVGIGIYLPMSATFAVIVGAVIAHWYDGRSKSMPNPERAQRLRLLLKGVSAGEIEYDSVGLTLSPDKAKAQHREQYDNESASHGGFSGWHTLLRAGMKNKRATVASPLA